MKKYCTNSILPIAIGIGTAMSVALKDYAVGIALGVTIFVIMNFAKKVKAQ